MPSFVDFTGRRFSRLRVLTRAPTANKKTFWKCVCDCGNKTVSRADSLLDGMIQSCGCYHAEVIKRLRGVSKNTGTIVKFEAQISPEPNTGCWLWIGNINSHTGYGRFYGPKGKVVNAHKFSYKAYKGKIPRGLMVRHTCDVKICVNPEHLIVGTALDNARDAVERNLYPRGEKHGCAVLTPEIVLAIRASKETTLKVARAFNISRPHVDRIRRRQVWTHLP